MTKLIVVCEGDASTRFDRDYYATRHFELAMQYWGPYGLLDAQAFYPHGDGGGWLSMGVYRFARAEDVERALASPDTAHLMDDVKHFTDATVVVRSLFTPF